MLELNKCYFGDCRDVLRQFIADGVKVHCVVTSTPHSTPDRQADSVSVAVSGTIQRAQDSHIHRLADLA